MQFDSTSFDRIRARALLGYAILAIIATLFCVGILKNILPGLKESSALKDALRPPLLYLFFSLFALSMLSRAGLSYNRLFGTFPAWRTLGRYTFWAIPVAIFSVSSILLLQFPLSTVMPEPIKEHLTDGPTITLHGAGDKYALANLLNFLTVVLVAPIVEEFFFRGILLTRWSVKWGVVRAFIVSSGIFALLHNNIIGMFCFACVMAIFYIRTKSLFVPMSIHITNNGIAWMLDWLGTKFGESASPTTDVEISELWQAGLIGVVITIPCWIYFWRHYILKTDWQMPYFTESATCDSDANSNNQILPAR